MDSVCVEPMYAAKKCLEEMNRFLQHPSYHGALPLVRPLRSHRVLLFVLFLIDHTRSSSSSDRNEKWTRSIFQQQDTDTANINYIYIFLVYFIYQTACKIYIIYVVYTTCFSFHFFIEQVYSDFSGILLYSKFFAVKSHSKKIKHNHS